MKQSGSILIVVLGLLAILAIVGVAFVTMSSIDRSTAANFALQSQFDLAADGAVDYVSHYLVQDLWEWHVFTNSYKGFILTTNTDPKADTPSARKASNWDYPGSSSSDAAADPWLCSTIESADTPKHMSFEVTTAVTLFGMDFGTRTPTGGDKLPDNLHFPGSTPPTNGIWVPDLVFPYESGIIRVSVTVLDHAALINLNAHGQPGTASVGDWTFGKACGLGYFICDVALPNLQSTFSDEVLVGKDTQHPGRWGTVGPGNKQTGEVLIENPQAGTDAPFTLDEEFELRRLSGTFYKSRLETAGGTALDYNPLQASTGSATASQCLNRLKFTTVGWTAEIRGDPINTDQDSSKNPPHRTSSGGWSATKLDLNDTKNVNDGEIRTALLEGRVFQKVATSPFISPTMAQLSVNIRAFRDQTGSFISWTDSVTKNVYVGARRQPIIIRAKVREIKAATETAEGQWGVQVQVYNPWAEGQVGTKTLTTTGQNLVIETNSPATLKSGVSGVPAFPTSMNPPGGANNPYDTKELTFTSPKKSTWSAATAIKDIRLEMSSPAVVLDRVDVTAFAADKTSYIHRPITVDKEVRGQDCTQKVEVPVLYLDKWTSSGTETWDASVKIDEAANKTHPIRFPHSVPANYDFASKGPLPVCATAGAPFRAFARLGDLNQVLCPKDDSAWSAFWPWTERVAKAAADGSDEDTLKFNWKDSETLPEQQGKVSRVNAANVFTVSGMPWLDNIDNDGDGAKDMSGTTPDTGKEPTKSTENTGRFAGPEIRIAGKINLNTASDATLDALEQGTGITGIKSAVTSARASGPIKSIAQIVEKLSSPGTGADAKGWIEKRDLAFTRISNVASVRSDTFSIYGTVQYIIPPRGGAQMRVIKSRRFWALVDRSPTAAYLPTSADFIHPRVLNFQWLD